MKIRITEVQISDFRLNLCSSLGFILFPYHVEKRVWYIFVKHFLFQMEWSHWYTSLLRVVNRLYLEHLFMTVY